MLAIELKNRIKQLNSWIAKPQTGIDFIQRFMPPVYVHRKMESEFRKTDRAMLIVGPRQTGKSTIVWNYLKYDLLSTIYLNMEDPLLRSSLVDTVDFIEHLQEEYPYVNSIFIDEIQHMQEAGLFVKGLVDARLNLSIIVTGSSSFHLRSRTRESLAGRAIRKKLLPFSVRELLTHGNFLNLTAKIVGFNKILTHQLTFGSYPQIYLSRDEDEKKMFLSELVEALILRDASDLFKIKRIDSFRKMLTLLSGQIGNLVNYSEIASICNIDVGTVKSYIEILEESHVVKIMVPFAGGKRREITGSPKLYFIDNGIRNMLINNFSKDIDLRIDKGQLLENWVFSEINKILPFQGSIKFWRSKAGAEVDFVIEHAGRVYALEVKFSALKAMRINRSARSFIEAYEPNKFAILNTSLEHSTCIKNTEIKFITPFQLSGWLKEIINH
jgi:predicted AAA+ superfamily ATPase